MNDIRFVYFDLGRVLVHFSMERMFEQIERAAGAPVAQCQEVLFGGGLLARYERGQITSEEFHVEFCRAIGKEISFDGLALAASDIFYANICIFPIVTALRASHVRIGVLSNTCDIHWRFIQRRFPGIVEGFDVLAASHLIGAAKPDREIYAAAAEMAGVAPSEIFFIDDLPENVEGARAAGLDAVVFTSALGLIGELRQRGLPCPA